MYDLRVLEASLQILDRELITYLDGTTLSTQARNSDIGKKLIDSASVRVTERDNDPWVLRARERGRELVHNRGGRLRARPAALKCLRERNGSINNEP